MDVYTKMAHIVLVISMRNILLINPNTNAQTTAMMVQLVQQHLPASWCVYGVTAEQGVSMITTAQELYAASHQVRACWVQAQNHLNLSWDGVILACYADPEIEWLRAATGVPTVGIGEASMQAASAGQRRFGIATTTPELDLAMRMQVERLGLKHWYCGARYTEGNPMQLVAQADALLQQLHHAVEQCAQSDGAQAVVIGGGPLGQAAQALAAQTNIPLIAPLTAAAQWMQQALNPSGLETIP